VSYIHAFDLESVEVYMIQIVSSAI